MNKFPCRPFHRAGPLHRQAEDRSAKKARRWLYVSRSAGIENDSGWRFFSGDETDEYCDNPDNFTVYSISDITQSNPAVNEFINQPEGSAWGIKRTRRISSRGRLAAEGLIFPPLLLSRQIQFIRMRNAMKPCSPTSTAKACASALCKRVSATKSAAPCCKCAPTSCKKWA